MGNPVTAREVAVPVLRSSSCLAPVPPVPICSQYSSTPTPVDQRNVTEEPVRVEPGDGSVMTERSGGGPPPPV